MNAPEKISVIADPMLDLLGYELRRTSAAVMLTLSKELEPLRLRPSEATMLMIIGANPGCTQSDVSRAQRAKAANLVPLINRLTHSGELERRSGEGRAIALFLTDQGQHTLGKVQQIFAQHEARITRNLPKEAQQQLIHALRIMCDNACCKDHGVVS